MRWRRTTKDDRVIRCSIQDGRVVASELSSQQPGSGTAVAAVISPVAAVIATVTPVVLAIVAPVTPIIAPVTTPLATPEQAGSIASLSEQPHLHAPFIAS